jgi:outer membrane lipoprotein-sorting protein
MTHKIIFAIFFYLVFLTHFSSAQTAKEIVKKADEHSKGKSSIANITIQTIRPNWSRDMSVKVWTKGNDLVMILVSAPVKEKGVVYLKRFKEVWNWIPSIERTIKMPPSMMSQSWMGTDFTNDDLVKEASVLEDYDHSFLKDTMVDTRLCYKIQLLPKPTSAVIWGAITMCIDKKDFLMLHVEYFDEDGTIVNTMHCGEIKMLGGRLLPSKMEMMPADKKGNKTVLIYQSLEFDSLIEDNFFTTQYMTKAK